MKIIHILFSKVEKKGMKSEKLSEGIYKQKKLAHIMLYLYYIYSTYITLRTHIRVYKFTKNMSRQHFKQEVKNKMK